MFDLQPGDQAAELLLKAAPADHGQVGVGCQFEEGRHRRDQAMMSLVPLEPSHRAHQGRARDLGYRIADREGLRTIADEPDPVGFEAEPSSEDLDLEVAHRDQTPSSGGAVDAGLATAPP